LSKLLDIFWMIREQAQQRNLVIVPPDPLATYQRHVSIVDALTERSTEALRAAIIYERLLKPASDSASASLEASKPPLARNDG
jgi:DNA-binding FadR family transcriptional regulator